MDKNIGNLLNETQLREKNNNEDWLVILVTDHGRSKVGFGHGNQTVQEKTIFVGINKKGSFMFENMEDKKPFKTMQMLEKHTLPQTVVVPTILKHLGISIKKEWSLDSHSIID